MNIANTKNKQRFKNRVLMTINMEASTKKKLRDIATEKNITLSDAAHLGIDLLLKCK